MKPAPDPLKPFQWKARVLVVSAPSRADALFAAQERVLSKDADGQADRELLVLRLVSEACAELDAAAVRERLSMPPSQFEVVLVGKDGTIALRRSQPLELGEVFARIDAMPRRREDLRKRDAPPPA